MSTRRYTSAITAFEPGRVNVWLRFARPVRKRRLDRRRGLALFAPESVFALLRWERGPYGTAISHIYIMRAVAPGETCCMWPYVHPGAETLLYASGWHNGDRALQAGDAVEEVGLEPVDTAPDDWRQVHNRLQALPPPHPDAAELHRPASRRRELLS